MLVLKLYKPEEYIQIGKDIRICARWDSGGIVISIEAPEEINIVRSTAKNKGAHHGKNGMPLPELQRAGDERRR
jgi:sRNA-binding carbon storage regulator CsrA